MSDVPRPFKKEMDAYQEQEENLLSTIYEKFLGSDLTEKEQAQVCDIDDVMLWYDLENLLEEKQDDDMPEVNIKLDYIVRPFETVEQEYNRLFAKYFNIVKGLTRLDIAVLARLCCALDCKVEDLLEYVPPEQE